MGNRRIDVPAKASVSDGSIQDDRTSFRVSAETPEWAPSPPSGLEWLRHAACLPNDLAVQRQGNTAFSTEPVARNSASLSKPGNF